MVVSSYIFNSKNLRLLLLLALWVTSILVVDRSLSHLFQTLMSQAKSGELYQLNYVLNQQHDQILVLGSSRANSHYDPRILSQLTGLTAYNAGMGGQGYAYSEIVVASSFKRYKPKLVLLDLSVNLITDVDEFDKTKILLPFAYESKIVYNVLKRNDSYLPIRTFLSTYFFNSALYNILDGIFVIKQKDTSLKGFAPLSTNTVQFGLDTSKALIKFNQFSNREIVGFENTLKVISSSGVRLAVVISPIYEPNWFENDKNVQYLIDLANKYGATVLDYSLDERFRRKKQYFKDRIHLYENGAELFTKILVNDLIKMGILK